MFRFLALVWDDRNPASSAVAEALCRPMQSRDGWRSALARPGLHVFATGVRPGINEVHVFDATEGVVLGKLFRPDKSGGSTSVKKLTATEQSEIHQSCGRALVDHFWGRYVAFLQIAGGGGCVIRDPSGALPCYRLRHEGVSIVFSWLEDVLSALPLVGIPAVLWDCLVANIALVAVSGRETPLEGVLQVLPGERVMLTSADAPSSTLLWNAAKLASAPLHDDPMSAATDLRHTVRDCVQAWANTYDRVLLRLSGGLDSAIVLSCLDRADVATDVICLNYHSPGSNSDERPLARMAALRARRLLIERERDSSYSLAQALDVARTPSPGNYVGRLHTTHVDAALAGEIGAPAMFTGAAGDQLFWEFRGWWPAADHLRVRGPGIAYLKAMDAARLSDRSVWEVFRLSMLERLGRLPSIDDAEPHLTLIKRDSLPSAAQRKRYTHPALDDAEALPIGKRIHLEQLLFPLDYYDPYLLEAAPELVNPLLSQPVIERCLATPTYMLTHGGRGRGLARLAFANDLPKQIVQRRSKGGMEEHVTAVLKANLDFARGLLLEGQLVRRGVLDRVKLETALSGRPTTLGAYTGEVHIYLGVEAWLHRMAR